MITSEDIGKVVSFQLFSTGVLPLEYKHVKVSSIVDYRVASRMGLDASTLHYHMYPSLPKGTPNNYQQYNYLVFETPSGELECVGLPWIQPDSIKYQQTLTAVVEITNLNTSDVTRLQHVLAGNGFKNVKLSVQ